MTQPPAPKERVSSLLWLRAHKEVIHVDKDAAMETFYNFSSESDGKNR